MSDTTKLVIVVLAAVVVLFVLFVVVGATGGIKSISIDSVKNALINLLPTPALSLDEIEASSGCLDSGLQRIVVPSAGSCEFEVAASSANVRSLKLEIAAGSSVHVSQSTEPVEDKPMDVTTDLPKSGNRQITLNFYQSGGSFTLESCAGGSACVLKILH